MQGKSKKKDTLDTSMAMLKFTQITLKRHRHIDLYRTVRVFARGSQLCQGISKHRGRSQMNRGQFFPVVLSRRKLMS